MNILLAEDDETIGYIVTQQLGDAGHSVRHAINGKIALNLVLSERFDVILMDVSMPEMSGFEVASEIRSFRSINRSSYIVALTSSASHEGLRAYRSGGFNSCLAKPVKKKALIDALSLASNNLVDYQLSKPVFEYQNILEEPVLRGLTLGNFVSKRPLPSVLTTISIFRSELDDRIERCHDIIEREDADGLEFLAHSLIGSADLLGAGRLAKLSRQIESELKGGLPFELWSANELLKAMVQTAGAFDGVNCDVSLQRILTASVG